MRGSTGWGAGLLWGAIRHGARLLAATERMLDSFGCAHLPVAAGGPRTVPAALPSPGPKNYAIPGNFFQGIDG